MQMPDFLGGQDIQRSLNLADNRLVNLYPTTNDKGDVTAFYSTPGLLAYTSAASVFSGLYTASNGRCFAVSGTTFYEVTAGGTLTSRGTVTAATVSKMSDNGIELILVNGTDGWLFTFATNTLKKISVLTSDFTVTIASPAVFTTAAAHGLVAGDAIQLTTTTGNNTTSGVLTASASSPILGTNYAVTSVSSPDNQNVYIASNNDTSIYQYLRDPVSGDLSPLSPPSINVPPINFNPLIVPYAVNLIGNLEISPDGNYLYAISRALNGEGVYINLFSRNALTGALTFLSYIPNTPTTTATINAFIRISSDGLFAYMVAHNSTAHTAVCYQYSRSITGDLTPLSPASISITYDTSTSMAIAGDLKTVYILSPSTNLIQCFSRNVTTGLLTAMTSVASASGTISIIVSNDNAHVYVSCTNAIKHYTRNTTTGVITLADTLTTAHNPSMLIISADDTSVYASSSDGVVMEFDRNITTGILTAMSTPSIPAAGTIKTICITANGKSVYAISYGSDLAAFIYMFQRQQSSSSVGLPTGLDILTTYYVISAGLTATQFEVTATSATSATFTVSIANPAVFTCANHGLHIGDTITLTTTGALPTGLATGTIYYVIAQGFTTGAFEVSATAGGTAIVTTGTQSGVHTFIGGAVNTSGVQAGIHTYHTLGNGFPNGAKTVSYIDGRFVVCEPNTQNFWVSDVLKGGSWDSLNVQTADSNPDMIVGQITLHNELIIFCEQSGETFYDSGTYPSPFVRNVSGIFEVGCIAPYSIAKIDNSVMWLGKSNTGQGIIYRLNGYTPVRLSTYAIEYAIHTMSTITDAQAFTYQQEGHHFYVITFPTGGRTFAFDVNTNLWHERAGWDGSVLARWAANEYAYFDGKHLICDYSAGNIYSLDLGVYTDGANAKKWVRSWRAPPSEMKRVIHHKLTLEAEVGVGQGSFSQIGIVNSINIDIPGSSVASFTWTSRTISASGNWFAGCWNGLKYCAVGQANYVSTSLDGITWSQGTMPAAGGSWNGIAWNGSVFAAINGTSNVAATSPDGITWTARTLPASTGWSSIVFGNGVFVTVSSDGAQGQVATSPDGITWTTRSFSGSFSARSIVWSGTIFVCVGTTTVGGTTTIVQTSPDGITWTARTIPNARWASVVWNGSLFCAVSGYGGIADNVAATSLDGITWIARTLSSSARWSSISWNGSIFCAVNVVDNTITTSPDGITWATDAISGTITGWNAIFANGNILVSLPNNSATVAIGTYGYSSAGTYAITFTGGGGTGAAGTYTISPTTGQITSTLLTNSGSNYTSAPLLSFTFGGIIGAAGHVGMTFTPSYIPSGSGPTVSLKYSNDGGHTWSPDNWRDMSLGVVGQYAKRVYWYRLGMTTGQVRLYELSGTSPVKIALLATYIE